MVVFGGTNLRREKEISEPSGTGRRGALIQDWKHDLNVSEFVVTNTRLLPYAKPAENPAQNVVGRDGPCHFAEVRERGPQFNRKELVGTCDG